MPFSRGARLLLRGPPQGLSRKAADLKWGNCLSSLTKARIDGLEKGKVE